MVIMRMKLLYSSTRYIPATGSLEQTHSFHPKKDWSGDIDTLEYTLGMHGYTLRVKHRHLPQPSNRH